MNKNVGIIVKAVEHCAPVVEAIHSAFKNNRNKFKDLSIFFDRVSKVPDGIECGIFSSSELACFSGSLICHNIDLLPTCTNIVNDIKITSICDDFNVLMYYQIIDKMKDVRIIALNPEVQRKIKRTTMMDVELLQDVNDLVDMVA